MIWDDYYWRLLWFAGGMRMWLKFGFVQCKLRTEYKLQIRLCLFRRDCHDFPRLRGFFFCLRCKWALVWVNDPEFYYLSAMSFGMAWYAFACICRGCIYEYIYNVPTIKSDRNWIHCRNFYGDCRNHLRGNKMQTNSRNNIFSSICCVETTDDDGELTIHRFNVWVECCHWYWLL